MARVWLNLWDCASGDLPACCVVCGSEDDVEYCEREMEYRPRWPVTFLGFHVVGWHLIGAALSWLTERYNREVLTKFPYCYEHYDYWQRRDRRQHLGLLILALGWLLPLLVTFVLNNNARLGPRAIGVAIAATVLGFVVIFSCGFSAVHVAGMKNTRILIAGVHPDFADAVERWREDARE